jgi:hypothetical protein
MTPLEEGAGTTNYAACGEGSDRRAGYADAKLAQRRIAPSNACPVGDAGRQGDSWDYCRRRTTRNECAEVVRVGPADHVELQQGRPKVLRVSRQIFVIGERPLASYPSWRAGLLLARLDEWNGRVAGDKGWRKQYLTLSKDAMDILRELPHVGPQLFR